ncbi:MAG: ChaN family lipoprotein [Gammaproteobacteria bacterium]
MQNKNHYHHAMLKSSLLVILVVFSAHSHAESSLGDLMVVKRATDATAPALPVEASPVLDLSAFSTLEQIIPALADKRVVFIGEQHTRYDHHLTQLEIIRRLHALHPQLAIGMEMFQQPFQQYLDNYVAGNIDEQAMLRATEYYQRWRMDYRHYAPILRYAREHGLPVIALNIPTELTHQVAHVGLDGLDDESRRQIPTDIAPADDAYRQRIKAVYDYHPKDKEHSFEHFLEAQLLWDEAMAERAAAYLEEHPQHHLVVIAGNQHIAWGSAIPQRLQRRVPVTTASILNSWDGAVKPGLADFLLLPEERSLPPSGTMGVLLDNGDGHVTISACKETGACAAAGLKAGDRISAIDNKVINNTADLRLALWDKQPGDTVSIDIVRKRLLLHDKNLSYQITLQ